MNLLRTAYQRAERLFIAIEDQIARPLLWSLRKLEARRSADAQAREDDAAPDPIEDWSDERKNPLVHWRWA